MAAGVTVSHRDLCTHMSRSCSTSLHQHRDKSRHSQTDSRPDIKILTQCELNHLKYSMLLMINELTKPIFLISRGTMTTEPDQSSASRDRSVASSLCS